MLERPQHRRGQHRRQHRRQHRHGRTPNLPRRIRKTQAGSIGALTALCSFFALALLQNDASTNTMELRLNQQVPKANLARMPMKTGRLAGTSLAAMGHIAHTCCGAQNNTKPAKGLGVVTASMLVSLQVCEWSPLLNVQRKFCSALRLTCAHNVLLMCFSLNWSSNMGEERGQLWPARCGRAPDHAFWTKVVLSPMRGRGRTRGPSILDVWDHEMRSCRRFSMCGGMASHCLGSLLA